jgi:drug/metabolite transporter (DMT)-like permease
MTKDLTTEVQSPSGAVTARRGERIALAAFITEAVLAGGNGVGIRISLRELSDSPLWAAFLRFAMATVLLVALMAVLRLPIPKGRALTGAVLYGLCIGLAMGFGFYALLRIQAGFSQIVLALVPLTTLLLAVLHRQERLRLTALSGTLLAFLGIALMSWGGLHASVPLPSLLAVLGTVVCIAEATVLVRRFPAVHPVTMNAIGMAAGAGVVGAGAVLLGEPLDVPTHASTWAALGYLVVVGSVVVFWLYLVVLKYWAASRAAYGFVLIPIVTVLVSAWLDDERITRGLVFGGALVLIGVYVGALRSTAPAEQ